MRCKSHAVFAAIVAIGIGPSELTFAGEECQTTSPVTSIESWEASVVKPSRTQIRREVVDARTRMVRSASDLDRLGQAMESGTPLVLS
jgi:hypothetical protein